MQLQKRRHSKIRRHTSLKDGFRGGRERRIQKFGSTERQWTMQIRSQIVARNFKSGDRPDLYAGTPPLEALKAIIFIAASVDVSRAYFHVKAQRLVLVKLPAEDRSEKGKGKIGLLKKSMYGTIDAANNWERDWQGHLENWVYELGRSSRNLFQHKTRKTSGLTHGDDFVVTGMKESLLELKKQLESVYPIKASIIGQVRPRVSRR